ncbi:MAG: hypothetical protein JSW50_06445 [Candidatus Latescibacterota bacterium]|nr:MAG: hypothetical protein JSW50_06445 [Candidatus Latescibacterota bacterium]
MGERKRSLGRDVFDSTPDDNKSGTIKKILEGKRFQPKAAAKEVEVRVKLTPSNIKQLDAIRAELEKKGKGRLSRNDLIRVAITLLSAEDF